MEIKKSESEKEEIKSLKKTVDAHKTLSEGDAEKKAEDVEKVSEELVEKEIEKETEEEEEKVDKVREGFKEEEEKEKEKRKERGRGRYGRDEDVVVVWEPKTKLGHDVKNSVIKNIDEIIDSGKKILEDEIVDHLIDAKTDLILIGQAKGKFGGGKRRAWRQTQRKTKEGNVPTFSTMAVVGDEKGHVGIGSGESGETLPARDKAIRKAKLNLIRVKRGCADFDCTCNLPHTVPFKVEGKSGSCRIILIPAPQGTGLVVGGELKKILKFAGIEDVYSKTFGKKRTTFNLVKACFEALKKTNQKVNKNE